MALWLREAGVPFRAIFLDTGWEHPDTYDYLRDLPAVLGVEIEWVEPPMGMQGYILRKGMFPSRTQRWCTDYLKIKPLKRWISDQFGDSIVVNAVGIRRAESRARAKLSRWSEWMDATAVWVWRPLFGWSEQDVIDIHAEHGVAPNPLYLRASTRVGCWPCIFARKAEIRAVADETPWRIDEIRDLESAVHEIARKRYAGRDETFESLGYVLPCFFMSPGRGPIDEHVRWSRTARGGEQFDMFGPEEGCVRWGLCSA
jgi:3'-phosphoadenosine 5'-phosphosulfate sulfotransferase (PAPS reductase)/FAD synthetase